MSAIAKSLQNSWKCDKVRFNFVRQSFFALLDEKRFRSLRKSFNRVWYRNYKCLIKLFGFVCFSLPPIFLFKRIWTMNKRFSGWTANICAYLKTVSKPVHKANFRFWKGRFLLFWNLKNSNVNYCFWGSKTASLKSTWKNPGLLVGSAVRATSLPRLLQILTRSERCHMIIGRSWRIIRKYLRAIPNTVNLIKGKASSLFSFAPSWTVRADSMWRTYWTMASSSTWNAQYKMDS